MGVWLREYNAKIHCRYVNYYTQQVRAVLGWLCYHYSSISPSVATPSCPWGMHLKKKSLIGMHLSNYNLFSFLVPEGTGLGNQTCSSHWNLVSSISHFCPYPVCLPELGLSMDILATLKNVLVFLSPYPTSKNTSLVLFLCLWPMFFKGKKKQPFTWPTWKMKCLSVPRRGVMWYLKARESRLLLCQDSLKSDPSGLAHLFCTKKPPDPYQKVTGKGKQCAFLLGMLFSCLHPRCR